ncbi:MAG: hypothetical protein JNJ69_17440 [Leptospiraceae bacterium]|nr:hypothetical protein [Leptospiraceae bacterium]
MRLLFARGEVLKYHLVTESLSFDRKALKSLTGVAAVVSDDYRFLLRIENIRHQKNLTPWLRRRQTVELDIPLRLRKSGPQQPTSAEFRELMRAARRGATGDALEVRIHNAAERAIVHTERYGFISATSVKTEGGALRSLLTGLSRRSPSLRLTLIGKNLATLKQVLSFSLPVQLSFYREGADLPAQAEQREMREVLVLSNISGPRLPFVEQNLDFWSRGLPGFRFRHVFGQLTKKRVEAALHQREWDCLIYRGHGRARTGGIFLELGDGLFRLPVLHLSLYMHLACMANFHKLELEDLPVSRLVTPTTLLTDFDDRRVLEIFFAKYRVSGSVDLAIRAVQAQFPRFVSIFAGSAGFSSTA